MKVQFREAVRNDVADVVALLQDDTLGAGREDGTLAAYLAAFDEMAETPLNRLFVGCLGDRIVATYHLTIIPGLTLAGTRRAQIEGVRVARDLRGQGIGKEMFADVNARARAAGCTMIQLSMNVTRKATHRF
ncbi:MAG: GNAT family N-acetyltransferase, partial [Pseudomonadota bacterium]